MNLEIRRLAPELADDYIHFFDVTPHDDGIDEHKCYCVCWVSDDTAGKDMSTRENRRRFAREYVRGGQLQGYLAYIDGQPVGWCNANTKANCLQCRSWRYFMQDVSVDAAENIKSVFCFVIAPEWKRHGIATQLLERVCADAQADGFDCVEVYPNKTFASESSDFMGPIHMYEKLGFTAIHETEHKLIMRKATNFR